MQKNKYSLAAMALAVATASSLLGCTQTESLSPAVVSPQATTAYTIYGDALTSGWENWSWNLNSTNFNCSCASGSGKAMQANFKGGGGLSLRYNSIAFNAFEYDGLKFDIYGVKGNTKFRVIAYSDDLTVTGSSSFTVNTGSWKNINLNWAQLGNPSTIKRITFYNGSSTNNTEVYIDNLRFTPTTSKIYYVSTSGSDSYNGTSTNSAFATIQKAADLVNPGDTVLIMNGTYTRNDLSQSNMGHIVMASRWGNSSKFIRFQNYPGHRPKIIAKSYTGFYIGASYIIVEGLEIQGRNDEITLNYALSVKNELFNFMTVTAGIRINADLNNGNPVHNIILRGNTIYKVPAGGIDVQAADYVTIEKNVVYENAWYSPWASSGISFYQAKNIDQNTSQKMFVRKNLTYKNKNLVPFYYSNEADPSKRVITDGNGIIIDSQRASGTYGGYKGRFLITNNLAWENGGPALQIFHSDNVDAYNNTFVLNSNTFNLTLGEVGIVEAKSINVFNNILNSRTDRTPYTRTQTWESSAEQANFASRVVESNLYWGGLQPTSSAEKNINADPKWAQSGVNFKIASNSAAANAGNSSKYASDDIDGQSRPKGTGVDIGAYESW